LRRSAGPRNRRRRAWATHRAAVEYGRDSLARRLYEHGRKVAAGEIDDPTFFLRVWEPKDPRAGHADPAVWAEANPSLGAFLHAEDFASAVASTDENEFRRFRLGQWTSSRSVAFAAGVWDAAEAKRDVPEGTEIVACFVAARRQIVACFVAARRRDTVAIVGCTVEQPHVFPIRIWEASERVDPSDVADELRAVWQGYDVRDLLCSEADWAWVLLQLADEGLPVTKVPRSPQRLALQWSQFFDATIERRLTHAPDPTLARHVGNLSLISGPAGLRPDLDVPDGQPIAAALGAMIAYDGVTRVEPEEDVRIILPTWVG
jgi:phage terminase large subunit-like protein